MNRNFLKMRGWPVDRVLALTDEEFVRAAFAERQIEKSTIVQRMADHSIAQLRAEIAELKASRPSSTRM